MKRQTLLLILLGVVSLVFIALLYGVSDSPKTVDQKEYKRCVDDFIRVKGYASDTDRAFCETASKH